MDIIEKSKLETIIYKLESHIDLNEKEKEIVENIMKGANSNIKKSFNKS